MNRLTAAKIKSANVREKLKGYPLQTIHEEDGELPKMILKKSLNLEIIISESFLK
ncbi:hypothetical protein G9Q97_21110 [Cyclobacterium sp. GBPx2]|uniref:Uncharacterized protein n=1 Tax=Cyclobacterium plantarum TaxID=2716263 RepID=A0ABX0HEF4_9BACT|nr:hypothetical protein [Cyclobacterium plantarum]